MNLLLLDCPELTEAQIAAIRGIVRAVPDPDQAAADAWHQERQHSYPDFATQQAMMPKDEQLPPHLAEIERKVAAEMARKQRFEAMVDAIFAKPQEPDRTLERDYQPDTTAMGETRRMRRDIAKVLADIEASDYSDEREQAILKLKEAMHWLADDLKRIKTQ